MISIGYEEDSKKSKELIPISELKPGRFNKIKDIIFQGNLTHKGYARVSAIIVDLQGNPILNIYLYSLYILDKNKDPVVYSTIDL